MPVRGSNEEVRSAMAGLDGVVSQPHRFGGTEWTLGKREIGHIHGDALVDIPFPKDVRDELVLAGQADRHHVLPESGWVSIWLRQPADVDRAIGLLHRSYSLAVAQKNRYAAAGVQTVPLSPADPARPAG